jgi:hypothetical protein
MNQVTMNIVNKAKYGSLLTGLQTQQSLKNIQFPKSITEANNVLSNHCFDNAGKVKSERSTTEKESEKESKDEENPVMPFAFMEDICYCCGKSGHRVSNMSIKRQDCKRRLQSQNN